MELVESNCLKRDCTYYSGAKEFIEGDPTSANHFCMAFPKGIPEEISYGENLHLKPLKNQGNDIEYEEYKAYAYLSLMDDKKISIRARMESTPGVADEGITGDMSHIVEEGEEWWGISYDTLYQIAKRGDAIDMSKLEELEEK
jgi:hypothetical protein